ncbi:SDR family oxidoreductase [Actinomyces sp.]|uniref:SDR family oxidoreductase n=1 Tax=Actinomyces sp. TaxID=29317 RepID=UPI002899409C|nr:SDR family oxidoreductase [Actinomyces sp.]
MADYLIIGGHGKVALRTAPLLTQAGHTVTSVIRNPDQSRDVEATGAIPLVLDIETASLADLLRVSRGRDAVIWSAGAGGGSAERTRAVDRDAAIRSIDAAASAGVHRYVMVSYLGAGRDHGVPEDDPFFAYAESKAAADDHLRASSLAWTVLGPSRLTLEEPTGRIDLVESGRGRGSDRGTSRGNVALTIAAALDTDHTIGRTLGYTDGDTDILEAFAGA